MVLLTDWSDVCHGENDSDGNKFLKNENPNNNLEYFWNISYKCSFETNFEI